MVIRKPYQLFMRFSDLSEPHAFVKCQILNARITQLQGLNLVWQSSYVFSVGRSALIVRIHLCRNYLLARHNLRSEDSRLRLRE